ncbi:HGR008Cp [Eremothecium sinecaudum]|uniref:RNA-directed DNA polymerase n=1 Tax=Eremothecium sinecaudum TaxID=45286 RepID=A0A0X8HVQ7_9SACH|nr:HGR008Cp [Eremothecium sinecaudum]AMD22347.1 HGR008Cp [Eremothecium sinecaudum]
MDRGTPTYGGQRRTVETSPSTDMGRHSHVAAGMFKETKMTGEDPNQLRMLLMQVKYLATRNQPEWNDDDKTMYLISHLGDNPQRSAMAYYFRIESERGSPPTFEEMVDNLSLTYNQVVSPVDKIVQLIDVDVAKNQDFAQYVHEFQLTTAELATKDLQTLVDQMMMAIFKYGLSTEAKQLLAVCPKTPKNWRMMADVIRENPATVQSMDKTATRRKTSTRGWIPASTKDKSIRSNDGKKEKREREKPLKCYTCNEEGHFSPQCPEELHLAQPMKPAKIEELTTSLENFHITGNRSKPVRLASQIQDKRIKIHKTESRELDGVQVAIKGIRGLVIPALDEGTLKPVKVLLDTGAYLSLVTDSCVRRLGITTLEVPEAWYRGIDGDLIAATTGVEFSLRYNSRTYAFVACVTPLELDVDVIVGTSTMVLMPEWIEVVTQLLQNRSNNLQRITDVSAKRSSDVTGWPREPRDTDRVEDTVTGKDEIPRRQTVKAGAAELNTVEAEPEVVSTPSGKQVQRELLEQQASPRVGSQEDWLRYKARSSGSTSSSPQESDLPPVLAEKYKDTVTDVLNNAHIQKRRVCHEIRLVEGARLPKLQPYRQTAKEKNITRTLVNELLEQGFIIPSTAPGSSPIVLVKKKDGSHRLRINYRELNKITVRDPFPLPRIDDLLACIGEAKVFSTLDLHGGYHQIPMKKEDREKTAFITSQGKFEYVVMPFGLVNATSTLARYMTELFIELPFVAVYLDVLLIYSKDEEEHITHLDIVLGRLKEQGLIAKKKKCHFNVNKVEFLGYEVSDIGIKPLTHKCEAIKLLKMPQTVKQTQRFLGLVNYYRRFIPNCSLVTRPLHRFIAGKEKWSKRQTEAVERTKALLSSEPILVKFKTYDPDAKYVLTTDASKEGVGGVLEEVDEHGKVVGVVEYFSKAFNDVQSRYPAGELQLLGIVEALRHFRYLLHGRPFQIKTDRLGLLTVKNKGKPHRRVARWLDELEEYDFTISYVKGPHNVVADVLSRDVRRFYMVEGAIIRPTLWKEDYKADPFSIAVLKTLGKKFHPVMEGNDVHLVAKYMEKLRKSEIFRQKVSMDGSVIYYENRIIVPRNKVQEVLQTYHDHFLTGGHFGIEATYSKIALYYYWPKMARDVKEYVKTCVDCQVRKRYRPNSQGKIMPLPKATERWKELSMDFLSGIPKSRQGNDMIMVVVDRFSKYAWFIPCQKTISGEQVFYLLADNIFKEKGCPNTVVSDRDVRYESAKYQELMEAYGIKLLRSTAAHPQTDGQTERVMQPLTRLLKQFAQSPNWDQHLWHVQFVYNSANNQAIKDIPARVAYGYVPYEPCVEVGADNGNQSLDADNLASLLEAINARIKDQLEENRIRMEVKNDKRRYQMSWAI